MRLAVICSMLAYRPFARFGVFPVGGRSTAIKLRNGDVWVLASTPLNDDTKNKLQELGPVKCVHFFVATVINSSPSRWIVGADAVHWLFLSMLRCPFVATRALTSDIDEFKQQYPDAKVIAVEEAQPKVPQGLKFDGGASTLSFLLAKGMLTVTNIAWGKDPAGTKYGFEDEVRTRSAFCSASAHCAADTTLVSTLVLFVESAHASRTVISRASKIRTSLSSIRPPRP